MTVWFGAVLIVLGIVAFIATGSTHPTSLIPCWFGLVLAICAAVASTEDMKRRMIAMHIAVTVALLGFLFPGVMAIKDVVQAHGAPLAHPAAVEEQAVMAVICLIFVLLCVRSFIAARRGRTA
jgi:hypothetical protein